MAIGHGAKHRSEILVVGELAIAVVLMVGAGLLLKSFWRIIDVDLGFENRNLLVVNLRLPEDRYYEERQRVEFYEQVMTRMQSLPGVQHVGITTRPPLGGMTIELGFRREEDPIVTSDQEPSARLAAVGSGYFETVGIPIIRGRSFSDRDDGSSTPTIIISEQMAQRFWPGENPIGRRIIVYSKYNDFAREIVGVVGDVRYGGFETEPRPQMYVPYAQEAWPALSILLATGGTPQSLAEPARSAIADIDPRLFVRDVATMENVLSRAVLAPRFHMLMVLGFAVTALFLAATGTYGMMSYSVSRRTSEIGLRMALGAQSRDLVKSIMGRGALVVSTGTVFGLVGAAGVSDVLSNWLFEVESTDPITFAFVPAVLAIVAGFACYIPARRAAHIDPMVALRAE
jgi:putative ABC transport system permease protein